MVDVYVNVNCDRRACKRKPVFTKAVRLGLAVDTRHQAHTGDGLAVQGVQIGGTGHGHVQVVQQAVMDARRQAAADAKAKIAQGVESFVQDAVASLREQTAGLCDEMLASMRDGKLGVHQRTLNRLVDFIDRFKALNFAGDQQLEQRLEDVRKQFLTKTAEEYRDNASARRKLDAGIRSLADEARQLARSDATEIVERFGQMGVRKFTLAA